MEKSNPPISPDALRSPLASAATGCYVLAFFLGIPGFVLLFDPEYARFLLHDLMASGIADASSLRTWQVINSGLTLLTCFGPGLMAAALLVTLKGKIVKGLGFLGNAFHVCYWALNIGGIFAAGLFVFRFFRFVAYAVTKPNAVMLLYSMIISEGLMLSLAAFLFILIRKFLNCAMDSCASIAYTLAVQKLDDRNIPAFTATGFLLLAIVGLALAVNRFFTLTIIWDSVQSYYKLLTASHPAQIADICCLIIGSIGNFLIYRYLRRYMHITEYARFQANKR